jgi:rubredoxin
VKRLPKKPAPARFGRKLTPSQKERATHICVDCGYIYCDAKPFEETDPNYQCPQCRAPKKRFARYNPKTGKKVGGTSQDLPTLLTVTLGLAGVAVLAYLGLTL